MGTQLETLTTNIELWRSHNIDDYWVHISYMGPELNRFGDNTLTTAHGKLWHQSTQGWREVRKGTDFWLFSVPGGFAWARDLLTKVIPEGGDEAEIDLQFDDTYGYVKFMRVTLGFRNASNFTFEHKRFGVGVHPSFEMPEA